MKSAIACLAVAAAALSLDARCEGSVGVGAGASQWPSFCPTTFGCDRHDTAWSARAGWMFSPYIGIEARYIDLGRARTGSKPGAVRLGSKGAGLGLALAWPFADRLSLTGVAGVARMKSNLDAPAVTTADGGVIVLEGFHASATKTEPYYGLGLEYALTRDFSAGIEASRYRVGFEGSDDVDAVMASITYRFR